MKMRKINYYYLVAGLLAILFSVTHEFNGHHTTLPALYYGKLDINAIITFRYIWHIITAENFIFGIALIAMAFHKEIKNVRFTAWLICAILITRLFVIVGTTLIMTGGQLGHLLIDIIAIIVYVSIIRLGTKTKNEHISQ